MQARHWWQTGVIYQIYPRSFQDSDGDGVGDLRGIVERLPYLSDLGVDVIWLSPIFPSPMADFGYDVADYCDIEPLFGSLPDFDELLARAHERGLKVVLDLVPNHTSDEHPWFVEARSSRDNARRDWYIWHDGKPDGSPPNNWEAAFGGPAWELDAATGEYYLHLFDRKQPDLNWRNPEVRRAIYDAMRFWLDRGVDGFRVDVIWLLIKDEQLRDNPLNPDWQPGDIPFLRHHRVYSENRPEVHEVIREMRAVLDEYDERVMIGEIYLPFAELVRYYGDLLDEAHLPYNFALVTRPWQSAVVRSAADEYEAALPEGGWPNWVLGNHDQSRVASRIGREQARMAAMLLLTLRGTPTLYYGDELNMVNVPVPPEQEHDPQARYAPGRDPYRSPMQWDSGPNAGFTTGTPWLPIARDAAEYNVEVEDRDSSSMLSLSRRLLALRRSSPALTVGDYRSLAVSSPHVFAFERRSGDETLLVVLNFSHESLTLDLSAQVEGAPGTAAVLLSTHLDREEMVDLGSFELRADEGVIVQV